MNIIYILSAVSLVGNIVLALWRRKGELALAWAVALLFFIGSFYN